MKWAYYNEVDQFAAEWLRELVKGGQIAPGEVDERSIEDVRPIDLRGFSQCHFFAGIGVWSRALRNAGVPDDYPIWTGSCPCQPFSAAGKGIGFADERHLWPAFYWLIRQCRPGTIFGEQVAGRDGYSWLDLVQADLEAEHYSLRALDICAAGFGAPHIRQRLYWCGNADCEGRSTVEPKRQSEGQVETSSREVLQSRHAHEQRRQVKSASERNLEESGHEPKRPRADVRGLCNGFWSNAEWLLCSDGKYRPTEPVLLEMADGTADRMGIRRVPSLGKPEGAEVFFPLVHKAECRAQRLRGYGNAITLAQAEAFVKACLEPAK